MFYRIPVLIKFSLNRWSGQAIANRTWCQCLPLFLATVICFLTLETGAEIRLKPINPPIEKWEKALISGRVTFVFVRLLLKTTPPFLCVFAAQLQGEFLTCEILPTIRGA